MNIKQICLYNQNDFFHKFTKQEKRYSISKAEVYKKINELLMPLQLQLKLK